MKTFKRILAILVIVLSVVGLLVCLAGVIGAWVVNTPLTNSLTEVLAAAENILATADQAMTNINANLDGVITVVDTINQKVSEAGESFLAGTPVMDAVTSLAGGELLAKIQSIQGTLKTVAETVVSFNTFLESINKIPGVEVPTITDQISKAADKVAEIELQITEFIATIQQMKEGLVDAVAQPVIDTTARLSAGLNAIITEISAVQSQIQLIISAIQDIKSGIPLWIDLLSLLATFIFLWVLLSQAAIFLLALNYFRKGKLELFTTAQPEITAETTA
jgi:hypothetical protein